MKKPSIFKRNINWFLISNVAVMLALITVVIGFYVVLNKFQELNKRLENIEMQYGIFNNAYEENYTIDPGIRKID